ncbi:MAG TPA: hypothetical protein PKC18_08860, partial [Lacipirellulaceae bacterium]|nr:hypothetical protein [Lacipirellulaceae bacterium]
MTKPWTAAQLLDAAGQFASGTLADELGRELDSLLRSDPVARRVFTDYMWLHSSLYSDHGSLAAIEPAGATAPPDPSGDMRSASVQQTSKLQLASSHDLGDASATAGRRAGLRWEMIAAALVGVAVASSWLTSQWGSVAPRSDDVAAAAAPSESPESAVAQITGTVNCRWARRSAAVDFGSQLLAGQRLDLDEGLAEITFDNGATVLLEGPASFVVDAGDKLGLVSGRLAVVTPQATGSLRIHAPALDLAQSGGEFGLWARESGAAEVHVFHGQVQADVHDAAGRRLRSLALGASEAIRVHPVSTSVVEFPADDAQFVRSLNSSPGPRDGLLAYEGFRYPEGPLEAQNGGFGWAGPWFTTRADDHAESDSNGVRGGSLAASSLAPIGNRAVQSGHYNRIRRQLATSVGSVFDAAGLVTAVVTDTSDGREVFAVRQSDR